MKLISRETLLKGSLKLTLELFVVFIGVYMAFVFNDYQIAQEKDKRRKQIYRALHAEIDYLIKGGTYAVSAIGDSLKKWEEQRTNGKTPYIAYYREPRAPTPPVAVWNTFLESGALEIIDIEFFYQLSVFYNRVRSTSERLLQYRDFVEGSVLVFSEKESRVFYEDHGRRLKAKYQKNVNMLIAIKEEIEKIVEEAQTLQSALETNIKG